ncbi:MAG: anaerobic ribonucleoside-triphosphate reductase activating protein [Clostridiales bacterium]|nr:anaerobic ribonucleoside-triphosphate reductase activating protein [Clostridiales bacterium]
MKFGGLQKLTLLDYPEHVACTIFTYGCNFRCPFCHNNSLVTVNFSNLELSDEDEVLRFLNKRKSMLEGVCITGGEPLLQVGIVEFITKVKQLGYKVKLDTNGAFPEKLKEIVQTGLVDYIAMDVKNSQEEYNKTAGCVVDMNAICQSVEFLKRGAVDYEFRTTVTGTFHNEHSIEMTAKWLSGAKRWYLQQFVASSDLIDSTVTGCDEQTLKKYQGIAQKYVENTHIRGI